MSEDKAAERTGHSSIETVPFTEIETILAEEFGERFVAYRKVYRDSLNCDRTGQLPAFPVTVQFELVNRCNLSCIMCYTDNHKAAKSTLAIGTLETVMQECQSFGVPAAVIGMGSEALLYKDIRKVISTIRDAGVMDLFFGTNATLLNEDIAGFMIDQRVSRVLVSLDAATPETYKRIRGKDELELVERNVRRLIELKRERGSKLPIVRLCFCVQPENLHERQAFVDKWRDWADYIDFQERIDFSSVNDLIAGNYEALPDLKTMPVADTHCPYPFNTLNVWANGDVTPCCTFYGKALVLGNVAENTLKELWDGDRINEIRRELVSGNLNPTCHTCLAQRDRANFEHARLTAEGERAHGCALSGEVKLTGEK